MTMEEADQFIRGREVYCTADQTLWTVNHIEPMWSTIYLNNTTSMDVREITLADFNKSYYFTDQLFLETHARKSLTCDCGVDKYGAGKHSDYCPKYEKER